jgi:hypothetical protein
MIIYLLSETKTLRGRQASESFLARLRGGAKNTTGGSLVEGGGDFLSSDGFMRRTRGLRGLGLDNKDRRNSADQQPKLQLVFEV